MAQRKAAPLVGVVMGSDSDWDIMRHAAAQLDAFGVAVRGARRFGAPDAGRHVRVRRGRRAARPARDHRRRRRRGPPARACSPRRRRCRCSACRSRRSTCAARTRSIRSCRCPRASRSPRSRSARPARPTPACSPSRCIAGDRSGAREAAGRVPREADQRRARDARAAGGDARASSPAVGRRRMRRDSCPAPGSGLLGGGQLGRMFCMAAQSLGYKVAVLDPGERLARPGSVADRHISRRLPRSARPRRARVALRARRRPNSRTCPAAALEFLARDCARDAGRRERRDRAGPDQRKDVSCRPRLRRRAVRRAAQRRRRARRRSRARCRASSRARASATTARDRSACARAPRSSRAFAAMRGQPCVLEALRDARAARSR